MHKIYNRPAGAAACVSVPARDLRSGAFPSAFHKKDFANITPAKSQRYGFSAEN
jgi:hypothetical protein